MIKTIAYNDFSDIGEALYKHPLLMKELQDFHQKGGNLNLDILDYATKLTPSEEWLRNKTQDVLFMTKLFDDGLITSPNQWSFNKDTGIISEPKQYGGYWYRNNKNFYDTYLANGVSNLIHEIKNSNVEAITYLDYDYNGIAVQHTAFHPVFYLAEKLESAATYRSIFENDSKYTALWKKTYKQSEEPAFISSMGGSFGRLSHSDIALVFYEFDIARDYFLNPENYSQLHSVILSAISSDNISFIKNNIKDWNVKEIEKTHDSYEGFLRHAQSIEMTNILLENNAFVIGKSKSSDNSSIFSSQFINKDNILETILDFNPEYSKYIHSHANDIFHNFFIEGHNPAIAELLIKKYNFPIENYDLLDSGYHLHKRNSEEGVLWALNMGADPRCCTKFIEGCVNRRDEGLSDLKHLHKNKILDIFYPDPLYNIMNSKPTKIFSTWLAKATKEEFCRLTLKGQPAWWSSIKDDNCWNVVNHKITNFNQLSTTGKSLLFYVAQNPKCNKNINSILNTALKRHKINFPNSCLSSEGTDNNNNNLFHILFTYEEHTNTELSNSIVEAILNNGFNMTDPESISKLVNLLEAKNNNNITPIDSLMDMCKNSNMNNVHEALRIILDTVSFNINYDLVNKDGETLINSLQNFYKDNDFMTNKINNYYQTYTLEQKLPNKAQTNKKIIKI